MLISRKANVSFPALCAWIRARHRHAERERERVTREKNNASIPMTGSHVFPANCIRQRQREKSAPSDYILITWNLVWMNTACYTTEYRQCLSPKGQLYLKADSEGKPDLTFNHYFRRSLVSSRHTHTYIYISHVYTYHIHTYCIMLRFHLIPCTPLSLSRHCTLEAATACLLTLRVRIFTLTWLNSLIYIYIYDLANI